MRKSTHLNDLLRYQEQLKATLHSTDNLILDNRPQNLENLQQLISQEQQLVSSHQYSSSTFRQKALSLLLRLRLFTTVAYIYIFMHQIIRFRRKIAMHKQYIETNYGNSRLRRINPTQYNFLENQRNNLQLLDNKMTMYENQKLHNDMGQQFRRQGQVLHTNIETNRRIQGSADQSQTYINFIHRSIMKRKLMFISLIVLFGIALIIVIFSKLKKNSGQ